MTPQNEHTNDNQGSDRYPSRWYSAKPEVLSEPTFWPLILSIGITLFAWGAVTSVYISALGLLMSAVSIAYWIGDIRREQQQEPDEQ